MQSCTFIYIIDPLVISHTLCAHLRTTGTMSYMHWACSLRLGGEIGYSGMAQSPSWDRIYPDRSASSGSPLRGEDNAQLLTNVVNSFIGAHLLSWRVLIEISVRKKTETFLFFRVNVTPHVDDIISFLFAFEAFSPLLTPALTPGQ